MDSEADAVIMIASDCFSAPRVCVGDFDRASLSAAASLLKWRQIHLHANNHRLPPGDGSALAAEAANLILAVIDASVSSAAVSINEALMEAVAEDASPRGSSGSSSR